jgi:hypothetical protein
VKSGAPSFGNWCGGMTGIHPARSPHDGLADIFPVAQFQRAQRHTSALAMRSCRLAAGPRLYHLSDGTLAHFSLDCRELFSEQLWAISYIHFEGRPQPGETTPVPNLMWFVGAPAAARNNSGEAIIRQPEE